MKPSEKKDKRLFEDVNKYLYDTPIRTEVCMEWVSANCETVKEKAKKELKEKLIKWREELKLREKQLTFSCCKGEVFNFISSLRRFEIELNEVLE